MEVLVIFLAALCTAFAVQAPMCRKRPCAPYEVLEQYPDGVELRHYRSQKWVSTSMCMPSLDNEGPIKKETFRRLRQYIRGANVPGVSFDITLPVITKFNITGSQKCPVKATRSLYLLQDNPPQPTNPDVFIEEVTARDMYTRAFDGATSKNAHIQNFIKITTSLGVDYRQRPSTLYEEAYFYVVDYTLPRRSKRYHESWLVALAQAQHRH